MKARPTKPVGHMAASSSLASGAQAEKEEKKAKLLLIAMFAGGFTILCGLLYVGSRFLQKTQDDSSGLAEVNAITAARDKADQERRQREAAEVKADHDKKRTEKVDSLAQALSSNVCEGDVQAAHELASELVAIDEELEQAFNDGNMPKNLRAFTEQRLLTRLNDNTTLRHWLGKRSPQEFARTVAILMFGRSE
jgi:hypothetical protein